MNTCVVDRPDNTNHHHTRCQRQQSCLYTSHIYIQCCGGQNKWTCRNCHGGSSYRNVWCITHRTHLLLKPKYSSDLISCICIYSLTGCWCRWGFKCRYQLSNIIIFLNRFLQFVSTCWCTGLSSCIWIFHYFVLDCLNKHSRYFLWFLRVFFSFLQICHFTHWRDYDSHCTGFWDKKLPCDSGFGHWWRCQQ